MKTMQQTLSSNSVSVFFLFQLDIKGVFLQVASTLQLLVECLIPYSKENQGSIVGGVN